MEDSMRVAGASGYENQRLALPFSLVPKLGAVHGGIRASRMFHGERLGFDGNRECHAERSCDPELHSESSILPR